MGCRLAHRLGWAIRMYHESKLWEENSFLTLTYDDEHVPTNGDLIYRDVQLFIKRLRRRLGKEIRYYAAGEYGDREGRPHYHLALFNHAFREDRYKWKKSQTGHDTFRSPTLEKCWPMGDTNIAEFNLETAGYIAGYVTKKLNGKKNDYQYASIDEITGEWTLLKREHAHMSLNPAIGLNWLRLYWREIKDGFAVIDGRKLPIPKYYRNYMKKTEYYTDYINNIMEAQDPKEQYQHRLEAKETFLINKQRAMQ